MGQAELEMPPFFGSARTALANIGLPAVAVMPAASASWTKSRRETLPWPASLAAVLSLCSSSVMEISFLVGSGLEIAVLMPGSRASDNECRAFSSLCSLSFVASGSAEDRPIN